MPAGLTVRGVNTPAGMPALPAQAGCAKDPTHLVSERRTEREPLMPLVPPVREKGDLLKLSSFPTPAYEQYPLTSLTAYCVFWLQQWNITTSLENLAVASHRMFPAKFAMVGSGFLVLGTVAYGVESVRSFSEVLAFTSFPDGTSALRRVQISAADDQG